MVYLFVNINLRERKIINLDRSKIKFVLFTLNDLFKRFRGVNECYK